MACRPCHFLFYRNRQRILPCLDEAIDTRLPFLLRPHIILAPGSSEVVMKPLSLILPFDAQRDSPSS